jgi:hypothetical protein
MDILQLRKREYKITVVISGQIIVFCTKNVRDLALSLEAVNNLPSILAKIIDEARFQLTLNNMQIALAHYDFDTKNIIAQTYQQVLNTNNTKLRERIDYNINTYVENVMLQNSENIEEPEQAILQIINNAKLSDKNREQVIAQQLHVFRSLENVKTGHDFIFEHRRILPSWQLLADFYNSETVKNETFIEYLSDENIVEELSKSNINDIKQNTEVFDGLQNFLLNADDIDDLAYSQLVKVIVDSPIEHWPEVSDKKMLKLLESKLVLLNSTTYEAIADKPKLLAHLIVNNTSEYLKNRNELSSLDAANISEILNVAPAHSLSLIIAEQLPNFSLEEYTIDGDKLAEAYLLLEIEKLNAVFVETLILRCNQNGIISDLFDRMKSLVAENDYTVAICRISHKLTKSQIKNALFKHSNEKVRDLTEYGKRPRLPADELHRQLLQMLKEQKILSDFTLEGDVYPVRKNRDWF